MFKFVICQNCHRMYDAPVAKCEICGFEPRAAEPAAPVEETPAVSDEQAKDQAFG